jgi:NtrC-family two-component system response regulator AlgB
VITVEMPPLRARPQDLIRFAEHYLQHFANQCARKIVGFTPEAAAQIRRYPWPGNMRELRNTIERSAILAPGERVDVSDLPTEIGSAGAAGAPSGTAFEAGAMITMDELEQMHIRRILERTVSLIEAAQILGIDQATLYRKRKKMGLE